MAHHVPPNALVSLALLLSVVSPLLLAAYAQQPTCKSYGPCDDPKVRDSIDITDMIVPIALHVMAAKNGTMPSHNATLSMSVLEIQAALRLFNNTRIYPEIVEAFVQRDDAFFCIPASILQFTASLTTMLKTYGVPRHINIFIACSNSTISGQAAQPFMQPRGTSWDTNGQLVFLNSNFLSATRWNWHTAHELDHALGLWHTISTGYDPSPPTGCNNSCYEHPHSPNDYSANYIGDRCADTPATPMNLDCKQPIGTDPCTNQPWGNTAIHNIMGYSATNGVCGPYEWSNQQVRRMHCWGCAAYKLPGCPGV